MRYHASLTVPAATLASAPASTKFSVSAGRITEVEIMFPPGQVGRVYLQLWYNDKQIYPTSLGQAFRGDDHLITFGDSYPLDDEPYELELRAWAPTASYEHTVYVQVTITPPALPAALSTTFAPVPDAEAEG